MADQIVDLNSVGISGFNSALSLVNPGETLFIRGGTFEVGKLTTIMYISKSGAAGKPITIKPYNNERVELRQNADDPPVPKSYTPAIRIAGSYIIIENIHIMEHHGPGVTISSPDDAKNRPDEYQTDAILRNCTITNGNYGSLLCKDYKNITVTGCNITKSRNASERIWDGINDHSGQATFTRVHGLEVSYNNIGDNHGETLMVDGPHYNGISSNNIRIFGNRIYNGHPADTNVYLHAKEDYGYVDYFYNNVVYCTPQSYCATNGLEGTDLDWQAPNIVMVTSETNNRDNPMNDSPLQDWRIYNNLIINGSQGIAMARLRGGTDPVKNNYIYNNTFINNKVAFAISPYSIAFTPGSGNNKFINNVVYSGSGDVPITSGFTESRNTFTFSNNSWYGSNTPVPSWASGTGDVTSDPSLVDPDAAINYNTVDPENYIPGGGSPLINAGTDVGFDTDYFGNDRSAGYDIGFAESGGAVDFLTPDFTSSPDMTSTSIAKGATVTYSDNTTATGSASITSRYWVFEGGVPTNAVLGPDGVTYNASRSASPVVTYATPGTYDVSYTVYDENYVPGGVTEYKSNYTNVTTEGGDASFVPKIVQFQAGDTTITHSMGVVPQFAAFFLSGATAIDTLLSDIQVSYSVNDLSPISSYSNAVALSDGTSTTEAYRTTDTNACEIHVPGTSTTTEKCAATVTAASSTTLTLSWTGDTTDQEYGYVILGGGSAITAAESFNLTGLVNATDTEQVSGDWDVVICLTSCNSGAWNAVSSYGFATRDGNQCCAEFDQSYGRTEGEVQAIIRDDAIVAHAKANANVSIAFESTYIEFTLNGGDLSPGNPPNARVHGMCFNISDLSATCGVSTTPTSASTNTDYSLSFDPAIVMAGITNMTSTNSKTEDGTAGYLGFFATDGTTHFTVSQIDEDAAATINAATGMSANWKQYNDDQTEAADDGGNGMSLSTGGGNYFRLNLNPTIGSKFAWLAIEGGAGAIGLDAFYTYQFDGQIEGRTNPVAGEQLTLTDGSDQGSYAITAYLWDFGDDSTVATTQNTTHTYAEAGTYNVTLHVTDSNGDTDTYSRDITVDATEGPTWVVSVSPTSGTLPLDVTVTWSETTLPNSTIFTQLCRTSLFRTLSDGTRVSVEGYGADPTITLYEPGEYSLAINLIDYDANEYYRNYPGSEYAPWNNVVTAISEESESIDTDPDWRPKYVGPQAFTFSLDYSPTYLTGSIDWDFGDGNTSSGDDITTEVVNTYSAVTTGTSYMVTAEITYDHDPTETVTATRKIWIVPQPTAPRTEAEFTALQDLISQASGVIKTTDWSKTGGLTNVYEATLERAWTTDEARVAEDGVVLTAQTNTTNVDNNAGSYYCTKSGDNLTIYVHTSGSDDPATNGSCYRFLRPVISIYANEQFNMGESLSTHGPVNASLSETFDFGEDTDLEGPPSAGPIDRFTFGENINIEIS